MAADALAPYVARTSVTMRLTVQGKEVHVFHEGWFQLPVASQDWKIIENTNILLYFLKLRARWLVLQVNGRLVLEGPLRVYWHVACQIQLKPKDDSAPSTPKSVRRSYQMAIGNGLEEEILSVSQKMWWNIQIIAWPDLNNGPRFILPIWGG